MEADSQWRRRQKPVQSTGEQRGWLSRARKAREQGDGLGTPTKVNIETSGPHPATCRSGSREFRGRDSKDTGYGKAPA